MSAFRFHTPGGTITLGEFDNAEQALEAVAMRHSEANTPDSTLEVKVGEQWHEVNVEGDMS